MGWIRRPETPLLLKELAELAARRRTYIIRFFYALALFLAGLLVLFGQTTRTDSLLGHGRSLFLELVWLQHLAVLLLVPAMTASALTIEKERETLPLLLLTRISPTEIILQKFLSRVVPVLSYVLLSFPLLAVAYSYGGVTTADLVMACGGLALAVVYQAAFSLLCSSYFRTTVEAIIGVYVGQIALSFLTCGFVPLSVLSGGRGDFTDPGLFSLFAVRSLFLSGLYLVLATEFLHRRAFIPPRNVLLELFQALDRMFNEMNSVTGGVVLVRDGDPLPKTLPVAWRETSKRSLGTFRYLVRVLVAIELPILVVSQLVNIEMVRGHAAMTFLWYALWIAAAAMLCLHAGNVIASERSRQTLDVLLATPLTGREILIQKLAGVRRLLSVLLIPFLTIMLFEHWFRDYRWNLGYLTQSLLAAVVFGWTLSWLAFWIGLRTRSTLAAVFTSFAVAAAICIVPQLISYGIRVGLRGPYAMVGVAAMSLNPATLIEMIEHEPAVTFRSEQGWSAFTYPLGFSGAIVGYWLLGAVLRWNGLRNADRLLGRSWVPRLEQVGESDQETSIVASQDGPRDSTRHPFEAEPAI
jgi:ABC-type transport system involved in multi-copper enzyme maturation permease subunit